MASTQMVVDLVDLEGWCPAALQGLRVTYIWPFKFLFTHISHKWVGRSSVIWEITLGHLLCLPYRASATWMHTHAHAYTCIYIHTHTHKHTHTQTHIYIHPHVHTHIPHNIYTPTYAHTYPPHIYTHMCMYTHINTCTHMHMPPHAHIPPHTQTQVGTHSQGSEDGNP